MISKVISNPGTSKILHHISSSTIRNLPALPLISISTLFPSTYPKPSKSCTFFSTQITSSTSSSSSSSSSSQSIPPKVQILQASLKQVHQYGWTQEAIAQGVQSSNLPLSYIGLLQPSDVISYFMRDCNAKLRRYLQTHSSNTSTLNIQDAIRYRLEMVLPYIQSQTWHRGMALGALENTYETSEELQEIVDLLLGSEIHQGSDSVTTNANPMARMALGGVYIATELHLLADSSVEYQDSWDFLHDRIVEYESLFGSATSHHTANSNANAFSNIPFPNSDALLGATAVASSLGSAILSLAVPGVRNVVDQAVTLVGSTMANSDNGTSSNHNSMGKNTAGVGSTNDEQAFKDLPPFDVDVGFEKRK